MLGMSYDKPAKHKRKYLRVLMPLLRGETASFQGEQYKVQGLMLDIPGVTDRPVVVAALGSAKIKLTAELAVGTDTWVVGPKTMEEHVIPSFQAADKTDSAVVAGVHIVLSTNVDSAKKLRRTLQCAANCHARRRRRSRACRYRHCLR